MQHRSRKQIYQLAQFCSQIVVQYIIGGGAQKCLFAETTIK